MDAKLERGFARFLSSYLQCALWAETDGDNPLDKNYLVADIAVETKAKMEADCRAFFEKNYHLLDEQFGNAGHDFWLTRNGHGAGFWDGSWEEHGDELTEASKAFGEFELSVGDDKKIYSCR